jgi:hypothetical protein
MAAAEAGLQLENRQENVTGSTGQVEQDGQNWTEKTGQGRTGYISVGYHFRGSMELNARILLLAYMVYL